MYKSAYSTKTKKEGSKNKGENKRTKLQKSPPNLNKYQKVNRPKKKT